MLPSNLPFRIGTTSYIIPDDILPNVKFLAGKVQDVQLVLFELDDTQNNLPDAKQVAELRSIASQADLTYTVHLPLDLRLASEGEDIPISLQKAKRVVEATRDLSPRAYIVHLDGKEERNSTDAACIRQWQRQAVESLKVVASLTGDVRLLAVENLEGYPITFNDDVIHLSGCSRCIDIGHLWLDGHDPVSFFPTRVGQASVMHIHGIEERDHKSLIHIAPENLDSVFRGLLDNNFGGVLTIEVFSQDDLETSMLAIAASFERLRGQ